MMLAALRNIPLFSGLKEQDLRAIARCAVSKQYPKHMILLSEGDLTDSLYIILSGKVKVFLIDEDGKEVVLNVEGRGEYFGEMALIDEAPRSASVMTVEPSLVAVLTKEDFKAILGKNPDIAIRLMKTLTHRARVLTENVRSLALLDVYGRVAKVLLGLATEKNGKLVVAENWTQQEIANMVGATRERVSRIIRDLITGGYIKREGKQLTIVKQPPRRW
jgi:CRP/FNR family cyclic AMP-dependent transcriptional regulator